MKDFDRNSFLLTNYLLIAHNITILEENKYIVQFLFGLIRRTKWLDSCPFSIERKKDRYTFTKKSDN